MRRVAILGVAFLAGAAPSPGDDAASTPQQAATTLARSSNTEKAEWALGADVPAIEAGRFLVFHRFPSLSRQIARQLGEMSDGLASLYGISLTSGPVDVYVFCDRSRFREFCERGGVPPEYARRVDGVATRSYLALMVEASEQVIMHELAHVVFMREVGGGGGSWLQEGVAVAAGERWAGSDAAQLFSPRACKGEGVPLRDFMQRRSLLDGQRTETLYLQAGAFIEFVMRGCYRERAREIMRAMASAPEPGDERSQILAVEAAFGARFQEIDERWKTWVRDPPRLR